MPQQTNRPGLNFQPTPLNNTSLLSNNPFESQSDNLSSRLFSSDAKADHNLKAHGSFSYGIDLRNTNDQQPRSAPQHQPSGFGGNPFAMPVSPPFHQQAQTQQQQQQPFSLNPFMDASSGVARPSDPQQKMNPFF